MSVKVTRHESKEQSETVKKFKQNPVMFVGTALILAIIIVAFVFWGANGWIFARAGVLSDEELTFGTWNGTAITLSPGTFFSEQRRLMLEMQQGQGQQKNDRTATEDAFKSAVSRMATMEAMKKARYEPSRTLIDRNVAKNQRYMENGKFSVLLFRKDSPAVRMVLRKAAHDALMVVRYFYDTAGRVIVPAGLENSANPEAAADKSRYDLSVLTSSKEAEFIGNMAKKQRMWRMAVFPYSRFPDNDVKRFAGEHADLFKNVHLSQITLAYSADETEAKKIADSISGGTTTFEDAAKSHSLDSYKDSGGDAGARLSYELNGLIAQEADRTMLASLAKDKVSAPIKLSGGGWGIFRAQDEPRNANLEDPSILSKVRAYMDESERGTIEDWLIGEATMFASDVAKGDWHTIAGARNIEIHDFGPLPLNYGDSTLFRRTRGYGGDIPQLIDAGTSEIFWKNAFGTPVDSPSAPFVISPSRKEIVVLLTVKELDDDEAAANSKKLFETSFIENEIITSVDATFMQSAKLVNNFDERYLRLFSQNNLAFQ